MGLTTILIIIFLIVAFIIVFKVFKSIIKAIISVAIIGIIIILFMAAVLFMDASSFQKDLTENDATFILTDGDNILTAFTSKGLDFSSLKDATIGKLSDVEDKEGVFIVEKDAIEPEANVQMGHETSTWDNILNKIKGSNDTQEKNELFAASIASKTNEEGGSFFLDKIKDGFITVKESSFITFIKTSPVSVYNFVSNKLFSTGD